MLLVAGTEPKKSNSDSESYTILRAMRDSDGPWRPSLTHISFFVLLDNSWVTSRRKKRTMDTCFFVLEEGNSPSFLFATFLTLSGLIHTKLAIHLISLKLECRQSRIKMTRSQANKEMQFIRLKKVQVQIKNSEWFYILLSTYCR